MRSTGSISACAASMPNPPSPIRACGRRSTTISTPRSRSRHCTRCWASSTRPTPPTGRASSARCARAARCWAFCSRTRRPGSRAMASTPRSRRSSRAATPRARRATSPQPTGSAPSLPCAASCSRTAPAARAGGARAEAAMAERIHLYDTTLRDGAQTQGVDFGVPDKVAIARELDQLGIDYIEGGWPGANPTDDAFFAGLPSLGRARIAAFGMTRRAGRSAANDPGLAATLGSGARVATLVGKTWDFHVEVALGVTPAENIAMIGESIAHAAGRLDEVLFDAEHFFDGYKANPDFALACVKAAADAGARWIVLCDTNGGTLPDEIERIVAAAARAVPPERLGIHCHNDTGNAVAGSLAAVRAGARQVQGTINGLGERCGNANLVALIPTLALKLGYATGVDEAGMKRLTHVSRFL